MTSGSENQNFSSEEKPHRGQRSRSRSKERERRNETRDRDRKVKMKVPELSASLYTFKQFNHLQTEKIGNETLQKGYDKYKKEWDSRQHQEFLKQYRKDAWFSERYDPQVLDLLESDRKLNNKSQSVLFLQKLTKNGFANIDLRVKQPSQLGVVEQVDEEEQVGSNISYIINQTFDIHMNPIIQITNQPYYGFDQDKNTLFIKSVPRSISRYDIRGVVDKLQGYKNLTMSDPVKKMNLTRFCWIEFDNEENCTKASLSLSGVMIKNQTLIVTKSNTKVKRVKILKNYPISRTAKDITTLMKLIKKLDEEVGITDNPICTRQYFSQSSKFDTLLLYLRRVHAYDYFTSTLFENQRILSLKVGSAFLRMEADYEQLEHAQTIFKRIQQKSEERIAKGNQIPDYMGILREQIEKFINETDEIAKDAKKQFWKCKFCDKKFKTCEFLSKHMISKHEEIKFKKIQVIMERLYLKDPFKITFNSLGERSQQNRKNYQNNYRRQNRRREGGYRDYDEPEKDKSVKVIGNKTLVNFLDI